MACNRHGSFVWGDENLHYWVLLSILDYADACPTLNVLKVIGLDKAYDRSHSSAVTLNKCHAITHLLEKRTSKTDTINVAGI